MNLSIKNIVLFLILLFTGYNLTAQDSDRLNPDDFKNPPYFTNTAYPFYTADNPLMSSGLIGPVKIIPRKITTLSNAD